MKYFLGICLLVGVVASNACNAMEYGSLSDSDERVPARAWNGCFSCVPTFSLHEISLNITELLSAVSGAMQTRLSRSSLGPDVVVSDESLVEPLNPDAQGDG